jgi:large subunit ribosomal protein L15
MGPWFEGGQMPLQRRLPKRGFKNPFRVEYAPVNVGDLSEAFGSEEVVDMASLRAKGLVPRKALRVKILGMGEVKQGLTVRPQACSASARQKIEAQGGTVEIVEPLSARRAVGTTTASEDTSGAGVE